MVSIWSTSYWFHLLYAIPTPTYFFPALLAASWSIYSIDRWTDNFLRSSDSIRKIHMVHQVHSQLFSIGLLVMASILLCWVYMHPIYIRPGIGLGCLAMVSLLVNRIHYSHRSIIKNGLVAIVFTGGISLPFWVQSTLSKASCLTLFSCGVLAWINLTLTDSYESKGMSSYPFSFSILCAFASICGSGLVLIGLGEYISVLGIFGSAVGQWLAFRMILRFDLTAKIVTEWAWSLSFIANIGLLTWIA